MDWHLFFLCILLSIIIMDVVNLLEEWKNPLQLKFSKISLALGGACFLYSATQYFNS